MEILYSLWYGPMRWFLLAFVAVVAWNTYRGRQRRQRIAGEAAGRREEAAAKGMAYELKGTGRILDDAELVSGASGPAVAEGRHRFQGSTDGISWTIDSVLRDRDSSPNEQAARVEVESFRWTTTDLALAKGEFLLLMPRMGVSPTEEDTGTGLVSRLKRAAAGAALKLYARMAFGAWGSEVNYELGGIRASADSAFDRRYLVVSSPPALAAQLVTPEFEAETIAWIETDFGLRKEALLERHGILLCSEGLSLSAGSASVTDAAAAEVMARRGAAIARRFAEALRSPSA
ncbi:MAG: hypothetical protein NW201_10510 [Gemmatimonadales bacterium]|nr:hypothetical protein [Gemmatimonadales bacterium]